MIDIFLLRDAILGDRTDVLILGRTLHSLINSFEAHPGPGNGSVRPKTNVNLLKRFE